MELPKKRKTLHNKSVTSKSFVLRQQSIQYQRMNACMVFVDTKWRRGIMINRKPRKNDLTMIQLKTLKIEFLFPNVILSLIYDFYFEGYQIALYVNDIAPNPVWKNEDDETLLFVNDSTKLYIPDTVDNFITWRFYSDEVVCFCNKKSKLCKGFSGLNITRKIYVCYKFPKIVCHFFRLAE